MPLKLPGDVLGKSNSVKENLLTKVCIFTQFHVFLKELKQAALSTAVGIQAHPVQTFRHHSRGNNSTTSQQKLWLVHAKKLRFI